MRGISGKEARTYRSLAEQFSSVVVAKPKIEKYKEFIQVRI